MVYSFYKQDRHFIVMILAYLMIHFLHRRMYVHLAFLLLMVRVLTVRLFCQLCRLNEWKLAQQRLVTYTEV